MNSTLNKTNLSKTPRGKINNNQLDDTDVEINYALSIAKKRAD